MAGNMAGKTGATQTTDSRTPRPSVLIKRELAKMYPGEKFQVRFRPRPDGGMVSIDYVNPGLRTEQKTIHEMARSLHPNGPLFVSYDRYLDL